MDKNQAKNGGKYYDKHIVCHIKINGNKEWNAAN